MDVKGLKKGDYVKLDFEFGDIVYEVESIDGMFVDLVCLSTGIKKTSWYIYCELVEVEDIL